MRGYFILSKAGLQLDGEVVHELRPAKLVRERVGKVLSSLLNLVEDTA